VQTVTSEDVAAYRGMVAQIARRYIGAQGAEFDDLEQEGLISVWRVLSQGNYRPSAKVIHNACIDWVRYCGRRGYGGYEPLPAQ
jgi:DNA-directed RNA polymerase specialized sigma24 family protein